MTATDNPIVLISQFAFTQYGPRLQAAAPHARFLLLDEQGNVYAADPSSTPESERPEVAWFSADAFRGQQGRAFSRILLEEPPPRWVHTASAGIDVPLLEQLVGRGARLSTSHVNAIPIAEFVLRSVLDRFQRIDLWREAREQRAWQPHNYREVYGTTWLVFGAGSIGNGVASRARAFGARVIGSRRHPDGTEPVDEMVPPDRILEHVHRADVIVLAAPATPQTRHVVNSAFLARMREGSVLVNVGRGVLVDEEALLAALDRGTPDWAVLDVTQVEPLPPESPIWAHPRIELTPHSAAGGLGRLERGADLFAENLRRFVAGEPLLHEVLQANG